MKKLGYDEQEARNLITDSESPDFLFKFGDKTVGIEVIECHPEVTRGKGAKNPLAAEKITREICKFIEELQDAKGEVVNYRIEPTLKSGSFTQILIFGFVIG